MSEPKKRSKAANLFANVATIAVLLAGFAIFFTLVIKFLGWIISL